MTLVPHKRLPSRLFHDPNGAGVASGPPCKRAKTHHARDSLSDAPYADKYRNPAAPLLPGGDDRCPRPLTSCAPKALCAPNEHDLQSSGLIIPDQSQTPRHLPQSDLSQSILPAHRQLPRPRGPVDYAVAFGTSISRPRTNATRPDDYISSHHPMNYHFGPEGSHLSFIDGYAVATDKADAVPHSEMSGPSCGAGLPDFLWGGLDNMEFPRDVLPSCNLFATGDPLSLDECYILDMPQANSPSPISRSLSRSSFDSMDVYSPYPEDYPTPASDTTEATTPAPSEACAGTPSEYSQALFGQDFSPCLDAKKIGHEFSYVSGSAPLSPSAFDFDFTRLPQAIAFPPAPAPAVGGLTEARRHSEPANLAACHFPSFFSSFVSPHEAPSQGLAGPAGSMTHPITDNLASSSASHSALLSSIAFHQTQLMRPLEIQHPRPVRGYKPPILLSGDQYDPKDFVRRRSEPILALPELDVASHLPSAWSDSEDHLMEVEEGDCASEEDTSRDGCDEQPADGVFEFFDDMEAWFGLQPQDGPLFDPNWSWLQSSTQLPLPGVETTDGELDWAAAPHNTASTSGVRSGISWDTAFKSH